LTDLAEKYAETINSSSIADFVFNDDGSKLFYLASLKRIRPLGNRFKTKETKILAKLDHLQVPYF
jgi:hypothetical protein